LNRPLNKINPKDLVFVVLYGIVLSILLGIMIGLIDIIIQNYILTGFPFSFSFIFFFLSSRWLGRQIRHQYELPNKLYTIIALIGLFIQALIVIVFQMFDPSIITRPEVFLDERVYIIAFVTLLRSTFSVGLMNSFNLMITYLFFGVGIYIGVRETY